MWSDCISHWTGSLIACSAATNIGSRLQYQQSSFKSTWPSTGHETAIEIQKINQVVADVAELKSTQQQIMLAIGNAEAQRWRATHPKH